MRGVASNSCCVNAYCCAECSRIFFAAKRFGLCRGVRPMQPPCGLCSAAASRPLQPLTNALKPQTEHSSRLGRRSSAVDSQLVTICWAAAKVTMGLGFLTPYANRKELPLKSATTLTSPMPSTAANSAPSPGRKGRGWGRWSVGEGGAGEAGRGKRARLSRGWVMWGMKGS